MTSFRPLTEPIDYFELAGQRSPGIARIEGAVAKREILERKGYAFGGAYSVYRGIKLIHFRAVVELFTPEQWDAWHEFTTLLQRAPTGQRQRALDFWHPITEDLGISSVLVESVSQPVPNDTNGWAITVEFAEYRRPVRALVTAAGSEAAALTPGERQIQAEQAANVALSAQLDALSGTL